MDGLHSCAPDTPIVCGDECCGPDDVCREGSCYVRSSEQFCGVLQSGAAVRGDVNMRKAPANGSLGWFPSNWGDGMLNTVMTRLHEDFLATQAYKWRSSDPKPGNCWVIGFPSDLSNCPIHEPWDDGCKGSSATIMQDGEYTFYNKNPTFAPVNYDQIDWCNDDHNETQAYTHTYSYTETKTASTTLTKTIKATLGMESDVEVDVDLGIVEGKGTFKFSMSLETDFSSSTTQTSSTEKDWSYST